MVEPTAGSDENADASITLELPFADRETAEHLLDALREAIDDASIWEEGG